MPDVFPILNDRFLKFLQHQGDQQVQEVAKLIALVSPVPSKEPDTQCMSNQRAQANDHIPPLNSAMLHRALKKKKKIHNLTFPRPFLRSPLHPEDLSKDFARHGPGYVAEVQS